jgi:hypothetical protein
MLYEKTLMEAGQDLIKQLHGSDNRFFLLPLLAYPDKPVILAPWPQKWSVYGFL